MTDYINTPPEYFLRGKSKAELNENFKVTPEFQEWLREFSDAQNLGRSAYVREALCGWSTLVVIFPEMRSISLERLRNDPEFVRNILVLLKKV